MLRYPTCCYTAAKRRYVPGTDIGDAFETTRQALEFRVDERENAEKLTIFPNNPTKFWCFDFEVYPTNSDGFARGVSDELEQQRRFFDDTKPHS